LNRILIVDDEIDITTSLKIGLERQGFTVNAYNNPYEAISNFKAGDYDLLILDIRMPKMSGFELYRELRKRDKDAAIWFLTAFDIYYEEFEKMFPDLDVSHFIRKPIAISELAQRIKTLDKNGQLQRTRN
jgi:DNA-binding response OmpR family regulator